MKNTEINIPAKYISSLHINGMIGRVLNLPAKSKDYNQDILLIYGHHSSIERMYTLAKSFSNYGKVTMPDLPGFGGMDSYYIINEKPDLDMMADYLATFIKLNYKTKKFNIIGMSYGFLVVTRCLQKYPALRKQVKIIISIVGFSNKEDFKLSKKFYRSLYFGSKVAKGSVVSSLLKKSFFSGPVIGLSYRLNAKNHAKMKDANQKELEARIRFEKVLWKANDLRTYFYTTEDFLKVNLTNKRINKEIYHVSVHNDQYFDNKTVIKNLSKIYRKVKAFETNIPNHAPTIIATEEEAAKTIPEDLAKTLLLKMK